MRGDSPMCLKIKAICWEPNLYSLEDNELPLMVKLSLQPKYFFLLLLLQCINVCMPVHMMCALTVTESYRRF